MPSGSRRDDFTDEQYKKQLAHSRAWKKANIERVRAYNRAYRSRKEAEARETDSPE